MTQQGETANTTPKTLMICLRKPRTNTVKFLLWSEPDDLVELKWCPLITPLLLLSFLKWNEICTLIIIGTVPISFRKWKLLMLLALKGTIN